MKLIFLHIPKAGGTTLHSILSRVYKESVIFSIQVRGHRLGVEEFTSLPEEKRNEIDLLKGHMPFGLHTHFTNGDAKYFTIFRNPVDRIVSHYDYLLRHPEHYLYDKVKNSNMTLLDYALSDLSIELDNHQCRSLLLDQNIGINKITEELYKQALENLQQYFISFGIVEEFDKSLLLFRQELGWEQYPYYVTLNVKPESQKNEISSEVITKIGERNYWDVCLYNWVKEEFARRLQTVTGLEEELKILRVSCEAFKAGIDQGVGVPRKKNKSKVKRIKSLIRRLLGS